MSKQAQPNPPNLPDHHLNNPHPPNHKLQLKLQTIPKPYPSSTFLSRYPSSSQTFRLQNRHILSIPQHQPSPIPTIHQPSFTCLQSSHPRLPCQNSPHFRLLPPLLLMALLHLRVIQFPFLYPSYLHFLSFQSPPLDPIDQQNHPSNFPSYPSYPNYPPFPNPPNKKRMIGTISKVLVLTLVTHC